MRSVIGALRRTIHLLSGIRIDKNEEMGIYDEVSTVVQEPAILIELNENNKTDFCYFRSIGWHQTMLIKAQFRNERWEAFYFLRNPSNKKLSAVIKRGKQIL